MYTRADYGHLLSPNRGVEGYIRLANSRDGKQHPPQHPPPLPPPTPPSMDRKPSKRKTIIIKPNRKQFTQVCTSSVERKAFARRWRVNTRDIGLDHGRLVFVNTAKLPYCQFARNEIFRFTTIFGHCDFCAYAHK